METWQLILLISGIVIALLLCLLLWCALRVGSDRNDNNKTRR